MSAIHKLTYGLFVLTAKDGDKDNGSIINTALQVTSDPLQLSIAVNKANYTHDMIMKTGEFNVSSLSQETPFSLFQRFGMQTGREVDKFDGFTDMERAANGIYYIKGTANAAICCKVVQTIDVGTHTIFIGEVTEQIDISDAPSCTYQYYFDNIKPSRKPAEKKTGWVCTICGYVYEGEELPDDFVCPICKHGTDVFEKL